MALESRTAVVYGAGGRAGGAMARRLAAEGARCFLVGRDPGRLDTVAAGIRTAGGRAETAVVDVLDEAAVNDHADATAERAGRLDIAVGVVPPDSPSDPLIDVPVPAFVHTVGTWITAHLLTTRAAARHMVSQEFGLILLPGRPGPVGTAVAGALRRQWACELGPHGVRVVSLRLDRRPDLRVAAVLDAPEPTGS